MTMSLQKLQLVDTVSALVPSIVAALGSVSMAKEK